MMFNLISKTIKSVTEFSREITLGLFFLGLLSFGSPSHASLDPAATAEINIEHMDFLNHYYPGLDLSVSSDPAVQGSVSRQLEALESLLRGEAFVDKGTFTQISCLACDREDKCVTC